MLLDDAVRLAQQAATADVEVTLDITPGVPHVFQAYHPILDEAAAALDRAGRFLSAHLAGSQQKQTTNSLTNGSTTKEMTMNRDLGVWTTEECALVLIDYQKEQLE